MLKACAAALAVAAPGVVARGNAPEEGLLSVQVVSAEESSRLWLKGVTDVLTSGIRGLAADFPSEVEFRVEGNRS